MAALPLRRFDIEEPYELYGDTISSAGEKNIDRLRPQLGPTGPAGLTRRPNFHSNFETDFETRAARRSTAVVEKERRRAPLLMRVNRFLQASLIGLCALAIGGYSLDVAASCDVIKMQEQARRLSEENSELSAQLLRSISFQGIQENVLGRSGLRVPEQVLIVKEVPPMKPIPFRPHEHRLPVMSGY